MPSPLLMTLVVSSRSKLEVPAPNLNADDIVSMDWQNHFCVHMSYVSNLQDRPMPESIALLSAGPPLDVLSLTPWYGEYRQEFIRLLRFGDHETIDHPVAGGPINSMMCTAVLFHLPIPTTCCVD